MKDYEFYRRFAKMTPEQRNTLLVDVRHDPLTPFVVYKRLEYARQMKRFYTEQEAELLRIAEETFNQIDNG